MEEPIVEFLDRNQILWTWNYQEINEKGKKDFVSFQTHNYQYPEGFGMSKRSPAHFKTNPDIVKTQSDYYRRNRDHVRSIAQHNGWIVTILHDTSHGHLVIDIDNEAFMPEIEQLLQSVPYYLSFRKKLPHFFAYSQRPQVNQSSVSFEDKAFDLLHGAWSSAPDDAMVQNATCPLKWDLENWLINYVPTVKKVKTDGNTNIVAQPLLTYDCLEENILYRLCACISPIRWHNRMQWFYMACALKSTECEHKYDIWRHFSKKSSSYDDKNYEIGGRDWATWQSITRADITIRSIRYYAKIDNLEQYNTLLEELEKIFHGKEELDEVVENALHSCSHHDVAELYLHLSKEEHQRFVYVEGSISTWYECREPDNRWFKSKGLLLDHSIVMSIIPSLEDMMYCLCGKKSLSRDKIKAIDDKNLRNRLLLIFELKKAVKTKTFRDQVIRNIQYYLLDRHDIETKFDSHKHLFAFNNGVFDFKQHKFRPIEPLDLITKSTGYNYTPERNEDDRRSIIEWIYSLFMQKEDGDYVLKVLSSLFYGDNIDQEVYILNGAGCNGKSVLINVVSALFGNANGKKGSSYMTNVNIKNFMSEDSERNDLPKTIGCRMVVTCEGQKRLRFNTGLIKNLSGREPISVRELYCNPITFVPMFRLFLVTNVLPDMDVDDAILRRIKVIYFPKKAYEQDQYDPTDPTHLLKDPTLEDKLKTMIMEFFHILCDYYYDDKITMKQPENHKKATEEYGQEQDSLRIFLSQHYVPVNNIKHGTTSDRIRLHYNEVCGEQENQKCFSMAMKRIGHLTKDTKRGKFYLLRVKTDLEYETPLLE